MPPTAPISVKAWISQGWKTYRENTAVLIIGSVILELLPAPLFILFKATDDSTFLIAEIIWLITVACVLAVGWCYFCLQVLRGENPKISTMFSAFGRYGQSWLVSVYYSLIVLGGLILLIIPGIIMAVEYILSVFPVMDKKMSAREALRFSSKITEGHRNTIFAGGLLFILISAIDQPLLYGLNHLDKSWAPGIVVIGAILYLVGILTVTPLCGASFAAAYDSLVTLDNQKESQAPEPEVI